MPSPTNTVSRKRCRQPTGKCSGRRRSPSRCTAAAIWRAGFAGAAVSGHVGFSAVAGEQGALAEVADWFAVIYIDAIDEPNRRGKHGLFQDIFSAHGLRPDEVLVVGD